MSTLRACAVCGEPVEHDPLMLEHAGERTPLCSFECVINFAVARIRQRREYHNEQLTALRKALRDANTARKRRA